MVETNYKKQESSNIYHELAKEGYLPEKRLKRYPMQDDFNVVFFMGDMNYRINGNRKIVEMLIENKMLDVLKANDQLNIERIRNNIFCGFKEGEICFNPTYKLSKNSDSYDNSKKQRIPAWTDRILFSSNGSVELIEYDCYLQVRISDHRPVYGSFLIGIDGKDPNEIIQVEHDTTQNLPQSAICSIQ